MIVATTGNAQEFAPIINLGRTVSVHRAMDDHRIDPFEMRLGDAAYVLFRVGIREALVVNNYVKALEPLWVLIEVDHGFRPLATLVHDRPIDWDAFFLRSYLHRFALEVVVVTTSSRYKQYRKVLGCWLLSSTGRWLLCQ